MKTSTIWESASRPLFVRSVWLESSNAGRGFQRHFILDYERRENSTAINSSYPCKSYRRKVKENLKQYSSEEVGNECNSYDSTEDLLLIGSAKARLHEQQLKEPLQHNNKYDKYYRRPSLVNKKSQTNIQQKQDIFSRRSSLQDLQSTLSNPYSNPDERLAERVLNWLDLAGKTDSILKNMEEGPDPPSAKPIKRLKTPFKPLTPKSPALSQRKTRKPSVCSSSSSGVCVQRPNDAMKHVSIIFNREGVPVRLNRPARNIDLCTLASSASKVKRIAGNLASARLYKNAMESAAVTGSCSSRKRLQCVEDLSTSNLQKRLHEECSGLANTNDAKRQLHIFMPSLPKKSLLSSTVGSDEANSSLLSQSFSELCKI